MENKNNYKVGGKVKIKLFQRQLYFNINWTPIILGRIL